MPFHVNDEPISTSGPTGLHVGESIGHGDDARLTDRGDAVGCHAPRAGDAAISARGAEVIAGGARQGRGVPFRRNDSFFQYDTLLRCVELTLTPLSQRMDDDDFDDNASRRRGRPRGSKTLNGAIFFGFAPI